MATKTCNRCGEDNLAWSRTVDDRFVLVGASGVPHKCIITRADGVHHTDPAQRPVNSTSAQSIATEVTKLANAAVLDMVAKVSQSFDRTTNDKIRDAVVLIRTKQNEAIETFGEDAHRLLDQAQEAFRNLMPQQHEIIVRAPDVTTIIPNNNPHYQLQRMVDWLSLRSHVWAAGPAGSGKTTAAEQAADILNLPAYVLPCGMGTNDWSLLGFTNPSGQYIPGHMRQPFEQGGVFVLDEIDNTNPSVLTTINGALSGKSYMFPDGLVTRPPDFLVVGCANTWGSGPDRVYVGRNQIDAATLDRFRKVSWDYDELAEWDWAGRDQSPWIAYVQRVRAEAHNLHMRVTVSPRASIEGAKGLRNGLARDVVVEDCIWNGMSEDDATRLQHIVGRF